MALYLIHIRTFKVLLEYLKLPMLPFEGFILVLIDYLQIIHLIFASVKCIFQPFNIYLFILLKRK